MMAKITTLLSKINNGEWGSCLIAKRPRQRRERGSCLNEKRPQTSHKLVSNHFQSLALFLTDLQTSRRRNGRPVTGIRSEMREEGGREGNGRGEHFDTATTWHAHAKGER